MRVFVLVIAAVSLVTGGSAYSASPNDARPSPNQSPHVTIDALLERESRSVSGAVAWRDDDALVAAFKEPGENKNVIRTISLDGALGTPMGEGARATLSPDGRTSIAHDGEGWFLKDVTSEEVRRIEPPRGETRTFRPHYRAPVWSADSRYVAFIDSYQPMGEGQSRAPQEIAGVKVIDMDAGGPSPLSLWASRITIVDRSAPASVRRYNRDDSALNLAWDDRNTLYVMAIEAFTGGGASMVISIPTASEEMREIYRTPGRFQEMLPAPQPGGDLIALVLDADNRTWSDFQSIILIDAETGEEVRRLTDDLPVLASPVWAANGEEVYALVRGGGLDQIYSIPLEGEPRPLTHGPRRHFDLSISPDGRRLSYQTQDGYGQKDIRVLDLESGEEMTALVLDEPAKDFRLGDWRHIRWRSADGIRPYGYLILPPDFDPSMQYPMIVDVHGGGRGSRLYLSGPLTMGARAGPLEWHAWAALGYVVFVPDYRSTGDYGPDVIADMMKSGTIDAVKDVEDIGSGVRHMLRQGYIDRSRVALLGHSAGGQRAYILLTKESEIFAAAILNEAIAPGPASSFIEITSGGNTGGYPASLLRRFYGGLLSEAPERYKENYLFDAYRVTTPTLFLLGAEDRGGVAHMPNEVIYSILKEYGVSARMLKFVEEGHNYVRPETAKLAFEEVRRWLDAHMPAREQN